MLELIALPCLGFLNLQPWMIAIVVPVTAMIFVGVLIVATMYFNHRRNELWHETARVALEKGQPLPPAPGAVPLNVAAAPVSNQPRWRGYLIAGLINFGVGAGLYFSLSQVSGPAFNVGYFGAIPAFIGLALVLGAIIEALASRK